MDGVPPPAGQWEWPFVGGSYEVVSYSAAAPCVCQPSSPSGKVKLSGAADHNVIEQRQTFLKAAFLFTNIATTGHHYITGHMFLSCSSV